MYIGGATDLPFLCKYELLAAERYRRFVSLVVIGSGSGPINLERYLGDMIRDSDSYVELDDAVAILMSETDHAGALSAIDRCREMFGDDVDLRYAVVSYPRDVGGPKEMLATAYKRFAAARAGETGAVISESHPVGSEGDIGAGLGAGRLSGG